MSIQIVRAVVFGMVKQRGAMFKLAAEFFDHCVVNGQNNWQLIARRQKTHGTIHPLFHPLIHINFALIKGIVVDFQLIRRVFCNKMLIVEFYRLVSVQGQYWRCQIKQMLACRHRLRSEKSSQIDFLVCLLPHSCDTILSCESLLFWAADGFLQFHYTASGGVIHFFFLKTWKVVFRVINSSNKYVAWYGAVRSHGWCIATATKVYWELA